MAADESHTHIDELQLARADAVELARGAVLAGRYEIEATLGRGGAGVVLRANDRELREAVAIKVLHPDLGNAARWIERLAREVKLARQLRHPNVCRVFDFEKADGHVFIVMELASGGTLRHELQNGLLARRPLEARLADARAVAAGLAAIHDAGIAHRDVTPQNVLRMADGRLVVSDFGLATEVSSTTTSIHGGTVAYMAPEVVRGQRATFASDVWSLGVVIHEIVFGERPTWSKPAGGTLVAPPRTLSRGERAALSICAACTAERPAQRPRSARDVEAWLGERRIVRARAFAAKATALGVVLAVALGLALGLRRPRDRSPAPPVPTRSGDLPLTGEPVDWALTSRVLAQLHDRVQCLVLLPDKRTLRFVSGTPRRAEDLDVVSGARRPARLDPAAIAQGCPDLAPDGKHLLYQGYTRDSRPYAFVSPSPDGRGAVPVVPTADPSVSSEPRWLADGKAFSLDVDGQHMGVFSTETNRLTVLPEPTHEEYLTSFRQTMGNVVYVSAALDGGARTQILGTTWPTLEKTTPFGFRGFALDVVTADGRTFFASDRSPGISALILRVEPAAREARRLGSLSLRNNIVRYLNLVGNDLAFASIHFEFDAWKRQANGQASQLTHDGLVMDAYDCGEDFLVLRWGDADMNLWRLRADGTVVAQLPTKPLTNAATCTADGRTFYAAGNYGIDRCDGIGACRSILSRRITSVAASPDGERVAFLEIAKGVPRVRWIPSEGGPVHEIADSESLCRPGWSSNHTIWVSRRRGQQPIWIEVDVDTREETGRTAEGGRFCDDALPDPKSPVSARVFVKSSSRSQIRLQPNVIAPQ
jgi:serine/threonine-protein kinase